MCLFIHVHAQSQTWEDDDHEDDDVDGDNGADDGETVNEVDDVVDDDDDVDGDGEHDGDGDDDDDDDDDDDGWLNHQPVLVSPVIPIIDQLYIHSGKQTQQVNMAIYSEFSHSQHGNFPQSC